jgi:hypothetical protein
MIRRKIGALTINFDSAHQGTADLISETCTEAFTLIRGKWGWEAPPNCQISVMTSWAGFFFQTAPWTWKIILALTFPFWAPRARRSWPISAAWTQRYGKHVAIGVKPPDLLEKPDSLFSSPIFVEETDNETILRHVTCHELVHASSSHLRLPMWLNEGIAAVTVDQFLGKPTILDETLNLVEITLPKAPPPSYREFVQTRGDTFGYHTVRGYWIVRLIEEEHPGFLRAILSKNSEPNEIEKEIATLLQINPDQFWQRIDGTVITHYKIQTVGGETNGLNRKRESLETGET